MKSVVEFSENICNFKDKIMTKKANLILFKVKEMENQ